MYFLSWDHHWISYVLADRKTREGRWIRADHNYRNGYGRSNSRRFHRARPKLKRREMSRVGRPHCICDVHLLGGATPTSDGRPRVVQDEALQWGKTSPVRLQSHDFSGQFGSLEGFSENRN